MCSRRFVLTFALILAAPIAARGQHRGKSAAVIAPAEPEHLDLDMYSRIRDEGFNHSHVMEYAGALFDDIGPRLTGSPAMARANEWTRSQLAAMGLSDAHLESWGEFGMAWTQQNASLTLVKPSASILLAQATPWSPATPGPVTADVIMVSGLNSEADFAQWKGKLKGKVILYGEAPENPSVDPDNVPAMELYKPGSPPVLPYSLLKPDRLANSSYGPIEPIFTHKTFLEKAAHFFAAEGAVALLEPGGSGGTLHDDSNYSMGWFVYLPDHKQPIPEEVISDEAYDRMGRLLDQHVPTSVTIDVNTRFGDEHTKGYNTIAEISGIDPGFRDQVVMVGGHLDSWIAGTGATDNGAGAIVAMEAMRILSTLHIQPRRSIRIALWSGEEQGILGSLGYVQRHFATLHTSDSKGDANLPQAMRPTSAPPTLKPEAAGLDAYFNLDSGSGRITGVGTQGNQGAATIFAEWMKPLADLGVTSISMQSGAGSDDASFQMAGLPGFGFVQVQRDYQSRTHHSNLDTYEHLSEPDLKQAAVVEAIFLYNTAMRDDMLPRPSLPVGIVPDKPLEGLYPDAAK
ncbi:M20/M25/M40 family metallo-hydrolase [Granulicella arctica]|uniref:M20/M25/M40 family metallo-hydrolase n=1 Tax=Granulicella arctica TaxID=940613 RepID=UPI0021E05A5C|nr:M20/M25/M40 family metallo-hydrolase [Granulicella arctica]